MNILKSTTLFLVSILSASALIAAPSKPKAPAEPADAKLFAKGTRKLLAEKYPAAEKDLRAAIEANPKNAAAHNNLAFVLRKQGPDFYGEALLHYNLAVELDEELAEAYMYRGVLHLAMGEKELALADHARLLQLEDSDLAEELASVIETGKEKEPAQFFGVVTE